ncbi:hypothetical protein KL918_001150 [Ogataea parapolymorpha]|uniref:Uncharacterized protein n=1 Tax=Ogataea parapolymorpha (strain ATCC 26012 / BCRC 20466 / JCM 22074 / NRRL Y-7560 / DL-1) TaxID=871575 RepID=W1Q9P2_OGAPD|nr:hypothetical protein HPODL_01633 [Ogataea parapolymorpha DL-1]ESW97536.1 hypothetical protein HPODL_01633 [Ogataea parapolymorpha DL-1]KAG7869605.1 hypothetical protein KL918_001150 [Ogataea parapolymorpha]KAG7875342.1 hypothetical protein KL916_000013 [Ogataea parapolymorpha]
MTHSGEDPLANDKQQVPASTRVPLHPIAIKPKPTAKAGASGTGGTPKAVQMAKGTSMVANKGSEEIVLTTSKNWILPPRPKIKKGKAQKAAAETKHIKKNDKPEKPKVNSQIHSNINLYTNNQLDLKVQLQNVTKENDNLKKILVKLNKEIDNLRLVKNDGATTEALMSRTPSMPELDEATTIDPINLSYNLESKRVKKSADSKRKSPGVVGVGIGPLSEVAVSSKDILLSTARSKKKPDSKADEVSQKAQLLLAEQMRQKQLLLEKQRQEQAQKQLHPCGVCPVSGSCVCGDLSDLTSEWMGRAFDDVDLLALEPPAAADEFKFGNDFMMYE